MASITAEATEIDDVSLAQGARKRAEGSRRGEFYPDFAGGPEERSRQLNQIRVCQHS